MRRDLIFCFALAAFLATGTFSSALAQHDPGQDDGPADPEQRIERHLDRLDSRLDLTEDQERRIRALLESHAAEMRAWRENNDEATREERGAQAREMMAALHGEISGVLTSEQSAQMEEMHQRMKQRMGNDRGEDRRHMRRHMRDDRGERGYMSGERRHTRSGLMQELDLSDEQKEQIRSLREAHRAEMKTWREEHADATREERRAWMRERAEQHRAALMQVLTEEQKEQFEELRSERRQKVQDRRQKMQERRQKVQERRQKVQDRRQMMQDRPEKMQDRQNNLR